MAGNQNSDGFLAPLSLSRRDIISRMSLTSLVASQLQARMESWLQAHQDFCQSLAAAAEIICHQLSVDGRLLIATPIGFHEVAELTVKRLLVQGPIPLAALAIPANATLELEPLSSHAGTNPWLQAIARPTDVLILLTPSDFSAWQREYLEAAHAAQLQCILLSPIAPLANEALYISIPSASNRVGVVELLFTSHLLCDAVDAQLIGDFE